MKHLLYTTLFIAFCGFLVSCSTPTQETKSEKEAVKTVETVSSRASKNYLDATWTTAPALDAKILTNKSLNWDFNFRAYSSGSADVLWTDPSVQRDVGEGKVSGNARPTAFAVTCDESGFAMFVFAGEPEMNSALASGKDTPNSTLECYLQPGDADNEKIEHYYQVIINQKDNSIRDFPWLVADRNFKPINGQFQPETRYLPNGYLTKLAFPWHFFWNRLPFLTQANNVWRFSIMRWCPGGGQSWGGIVHEQTRFGYVSWPEFTPERRTAILKGILRFAWNRYNAHKKNYGPGNFPADVSPYFQSQKQDNHSNVFLPEYQTFAQDVLAPMIAERDALAKDIGTFEQKTPAEQEDFYRKNIGKLMNYDYDAQEAFKAWLSQKLITGEIVK